MKKIISLLMAAIFVFSMAVPSFAAASVNDVAQPAAISSSASIMPRRRALFAEEYFCQICITFAPA